MSPFCNLISLSLHFVQFFVLLLFLISHNILSHWKYFSLKSYIVPFLFILYFPNKQKKIEETIKEPSQEILDKFEDYYTKTDKKFLIGTKEQILRTWISVNYSPLKF